jgi:hypothetical protein
MKRFATFAAMLISLVTFGQDSLETKVEKDFKRLLIGVNVSPDYCYRTLKNNNGSSTSSMIIELRDEGEQFKIGYTAGLNVCYNISKKLGIELGVQYSNKGYAHRKGKLTFADVIDPRYGINYGSNGSSASTPASIKLFYDHKYLDLPVRAIYSFGKRRIHFVASLGVTTNIFLEATQTMIIKYESEDTWRKTVDQQEDFKSLNISPTISFGADYRISNKFNLRVEPTFRYGILKIIDTPITAYLWNGGLNITCYYSLK